MEIGIGTFGGCFRNMVGMPRKVLEVFPMMSQNVESGFVEIGMATFGGCFINMAQKVFPMMSYNVESGFVEIGVGTSGGCFVNMARMRGRFSQ